MFQPLYLSINTKLYENRTISDAVTLSLFTYPTLFLNLSTVQYEILNTTHKQYEILQFKIFTIIFRKSPHTQTPPKDQNLKIQKVPKNQNEATSRRNAGGVFDQVNKGEEEMVYIARASLLSSENVSNKVGYRGVLNLSILLLILTHLRLILENLVRRRQFLKRLYARLTTNKSKQQKYGVLINPTLLTGIWGSGDWYEWPATALLIGCQVNILIAFLIERAASSRSFTKCSDRFVLLANLVNITASLLVSVIWIYFNSEHGSLNPAQGILILLTTIVICMKYFVCLDEHGTEEVFVRTSQHPQSVWASTWSLKKKNDDFEVLVSDNVTLRNLYTFIVFPTLVALHYPRTKRIRKGSRRVVEMVSISIIVVSWLNNGYFPLYATQNSMSSMLYTSPACDETCDSDMYG